MTVIVTVPIAVPPCPSFASYVNVSVAVWPRGIAETSRTGRVIRERPIGVHHHGGAVGARAGERRGPAGPVELIDRQRVAVGVGVVGEHPARDDTVKTALLVAA